jgi:hypothetical protein
VGLIVLALIFIKYMPRLQWYYAMLPILAGIYNIGLFVKRIELDGVNKVIPISCFGLLKKEHPFDDIYNFATSRHMAYGIIHSGTDINTILIR